MCKHRVLILLGMFLLPMVVNAQWSVLGEVDYVFVHYDKYILITQIPENTCGSAGKYWWYMTDEGAKEMYAMALAATMSGKRIGVVYDANTPNCVYGGEKITHMKMKR